MTKIKEKTIKINETRNEKKETKNFAKRSKVDGKREERINENETIIKHLIMGKQNVMKERIK